MTSDEIRHLPSTQGHVTLAFGDDSIRGRSTLGGGHDHRALVFREHPQERSWWPSPSFLRSPKPAQFHLVAIIPLGFPGRKFRPRNEQELCWNSCDPLQTSKATWEKFKETIRKRTSGGKVVKGQMARGPHAWERDTSRPRSAASPASAELCGAEQRGENRTLEERVRGRGRKGRRGLVVFRHRESTRPSLPDSNDEQGKGK